MNTNNNYTIVPLIRPTSISKVYSLAPTKGYPTTSTKVYSTITSYTLASTYITISPSSSTSIYLFTI